LTDFWGNTVSKLVVISVGQGDSQTGFPHITAQIWPDGNSIQVSVVGKLPADLEIANLYERWRQLYSAFYQQLGSLRTPIEWGEDLTNFSDVEFKKLSKQLEDKIHGWLESKEFSRIEKQLRSQIGSTSEQVRVIIKTDDDLLQRLPWSSWEFLKDYRQAEVALSPPQYKRPQQSPPTTPRSTIRILAILGDSTGINIQEDGDLLKNLPDADPMFLVEPNRQELDQWLWDEQGWDILFFAGHSRTEVTTGLIYINSTESLSISQLRNALSQAIERGLQLAIFNSCDGLGLARNLADLHIPQMIVMREPVPDQVAQEFLKNFLVAFSRGKSLYVSVREAREQLQRLEGQFPCASWLPVIWQNPAETPKSWQELLGSITPQRPNIKSRQVSLSWFAPDTRKQQQQILNIPVAIGRKLDEVLTDVEKQHYSQVFLEDQSVSRCHARITFDNGQLTLKDQSANGTLLNGNNNIHQSSHLLSDGNTLKIGPYTITVKLVVTPNPDSTTIFDPRYPVPKPISPMTAISLGRWLTRIFLLATVGVLVSLPFALGYWGLRASLNYYWVLFYIGLFGLAWDVLYDFLHKFLRKRNWVRVFPLCAAIVEAVVLASLIKIGALPGIPPEEFDLAWFVLHYSLVLIAIYLCFWMVVRRLFPRRFGGGR
jgi:hypothetical protein